MEIVPSRRQLDAAAAAGSGGTGALPTYRAAPQLEVRLEEFELFAIDRLRGASLCSLYCRSCSPRCFLRYCSDLANGLECDALRCDVLGSSQGDLGWALAGEEAGGDGEAGERFSLAVLSFGD